MEMMGLGTRSRICVGLGIAVVAFVVVSPASAQFSAADLTGGWEIEGTVSGGPAYTGDLDLSPSGGAYIASGKMVFSWGDLAFQGWGVVYGDVLYLFRWVGASQFLLIHEVRFEATTGTYRSDWSTLGSLTGREAMRRPAPVTPPPTIDVFVGGSPRVEELAAKIASGRYTIEEAREFLDKNFEESQEYIRQNIRNDIEPNFTRGHRGPMTGMVVHYTAGQSMSSTLRYFTGRQSRSASSHFLADLDGRLIQVFSHENRSWHAGSKFNHTHFGFDYVNCGYLKKKGDKFIDYYGTSSS